jgi:hypothetical protein
MAEQGKGFIKLDRNLVRWRWWKNHNTCHVFITLLLLANYKDGDFEKTVIHRGQLATSHGTLSGLTGLTISQIRTALSNLISTGEIAITRKPRYIVITIINYNKYQDTSTQIADKSQTNHNQIASKSQQSKNSKNIKKERIPPKSPKGGLAPSGDDKPKRGTDEFRVKSHLLLKPDEGTVDDIPEMYRDMYKTFADYWRYRNQ